MLGRLFMRPARSLGRVKGTSWASTFQCSSEGSGHSGAPLASSSLACRRLQRAFLRVGMAAVGTVGRERMREGCTALRLKLPQRQKGPQEIARTTVPHHPSQASAETTAHTQGLYMQSRGEGALSLDPSHSLSLSLFFFFFASCYMIRFTPGLIMRVWQPLCPRPTFPIHRPPSSRSTGSCDMKEKPRFEHITEETDGKGEKRNKWLGRQEGKTKPRPRASQVGWRVGGRWDVSRLSDCPRLPWPGSVTEATAQSQTCCPMSHRQGKKGEMVLLHILGVRTPKTA